MGSHILITSATQGCILMRCFNTMANRLHNSLPLQLLVDIALPKTSTTLLTVATTTTQISHIRYRYYNILNCCCTTSAYGVIIRVIPTVQSTYTPTQLLQANYNTPTIIVKVNNSSDKVLSATLVQVETSNPVSTQVLPLHSDLYYCQP